jgi:glutamyl-tRNA reductase
MRLLVLGVSHHTAPIELRERIAFAAPDLGDAATALAQEPAIGEAVLLSTCNRTELYATCTSLEDGHDALAGFLARARTVPADALRAHVYTRTEADAARHLFRVAAGLDSLVVGEPQILGQVKQAYASAADHHATGPLLNRLFHTAFTAGKRVRTETELAEGAVSISYAALGLARKICGDLRHSSVLVIGAGEMAELTARHFAAQQPKRIVVCSRTAAHAEALAAEVGGTVLPWAELDSALGQADVVVTATGATTPILTRPRLQGALRPRRGRPLFLIDIAVPRDVDPAVAADDDVFLYNIDDLQSVVNESLSRRSSETTRAETIVNQEVEKFMAWARSRTAMPTVVALRQRFEAIRRAELDRLQPKIAGLPPEARARVDEITRLIIEKLLITPTEQLKALPDQQLQSSYADALSHLFALASPDEKPGETDDQDDEPGTGQAAAGPRKVAGP